MKYLCSLPAKLLFVTCLLWLCSSENFAQSPTLRESDGPTLVQVLSKNKKDIDKADMNIQFASSLNADFTNWNFNEMAFKVQRVRFEISGAFNKKFTYNLRQSFNQYTNTNVQLDDLAYLVELAYVGWQVNDRWNLVVGKQATQFSGWEYWVNAIKVREYSEFNNTVPGYMTGFNVNYKLTPTQNFNFQVVNNLLGGPEDLFVYGLPEGVEKSKVPLLATLNWDGKFVDDALGIRYSLSYGQQAHKNNIFYFTCGHLWEKNPFVAYIDFMYSHENLDSKGYISSSVKNAEGKNQTLRDVNYFTTIANLDYRISKSFNIYAKATYETGNVFKNNDYFKSGAYRRSLTVQLCTQYYPLPDIDLHFYLHLSYNKVAFTELAKSYGAGNYDRENIALGLVYTLPVF